MGTLQKWCLLGVLAQNLEKKRSSGSLKKRCLLRELVKIMVLDQILKKAGFPVARRGAVLVERRLLEEFVQNSLTGPRRAVK